MKTSNKLLAVASLLLVTAAIVNALTLKSRFNAMLTEAPATLRAFHAEAFNAVELLGTAPKGMKLRVAMKRADRLAVRYADLDFIHIQQTGTTLKITIDHPKDYTTDIRKQPEISIECPNLIALTAVGTPLDSLDLPGDAHALTRRAYSVSTVNIQGFQDNGLQVMASNGMEVTMHNTKIDSLSAVVGRAAKLEIRQDTLTYARLDVGDEGTVTLDQTSIGTLSTRVAKKGQVIVKGAQLITAYGNGEHRNP